MTGSSFLHECSATDWSPLPPGTDHEPRHSRRSEASRRCTRRTPGVIDEPDVEVVYNALVNSLHAPWNQYALNAGKHVLSEKPVASNAAEASQVCELARNASGQIVEGFHYLHHPVNLRLRELVTSGSLGEIQRVDIELSIPSPPDGDPRWQLELAGGATMDLGCYVLNAARQFGRWVGQAP
jgi:predicted dehydrogenase